MGAAAPIAKAVANAEEEELRRLLAEIGEDIEVPDGAGGMTRASAALDDARAWTKAVAEVKICGLGGG